MTGKDPPRWVEPDSDASEEIRTLFEAGRQDGPGADRVRKIALALNISPPTGGGEPGPDPSQGGSTGSASGAEGTAAAAAQAAGGTATTAVALWVKGAVGSIMAAAVIGGALVLWPQAPEQETISTTAPNEDDLYHESVQVVEPQEGNDSSERSSSRPAVVEPPPSTDISEPSLPSERVRAPRISREASNASDENADAGSSGDLAMEARLLQQAQDALSSAPRSSLRLLEQHRAQFPRGVLTQEREVLAIDALVRLGRIQPARARADRFRRRFPSYSHRRVDRILDGGVSAEEGDHEDSPSAESE